jgi:hypothetical protein
MSIEHKVLSLYDLALIQSSQLLFQTFNDPKGNDYFLRVRVPQTIASQLLQNMPPNQAHSDLAASRVAQFISVQNPNPLFLSQNQFDIKYVLNALNDQKIFINPSSATIIGMEFSPHVVRMIANKCPHLSSLHISESRGDFSELRELKEIRVLDLSFVTLSDEDVQKLAEYLKSNQTLQHLVLNDLCFKNKSLKDAHTVRLLESLKHHSRLQTLEYSNNGLGLSSILGMKELIEASSTLLHIKFTFDLFSDPGSVSLIPALQSKPYIFLDLSENMLENNTKLQLQAVQKLKNDNGPKD